jgi:hypothetical protein
MSWTLGCVSLLVFVGGLGRYVIGHPGPRAVCSKRTHDFGIAGTGDVVEGEFRIQNRGFGRLEIVSVRSSCPCTSGVVSQRTVYPFSAALITARVSLHGIEGWMRSSILVTTNDPVNSKLLLHISGQVVAGVSGREVHAPDDGK